MDIQIEPYSLGHILLCLTVVAAVALMIRILKNKNKTKVISIVGIVLLLLEVLNQILLFEIYGTYYWSDFPFQLCSIPMYMCLVYPFFIKGRPYIETFLKSFGLLGAVTAFLIPYDVISSHTALAIISTTWHMILMFLGIFCIVASDKENIADSKSCQLKNTRLKSNQLKSNQIKGNLKSIQIKNIRINAYIYLVLALIAVCINAALFKISGGTSNMFFLGPAKPRVLILDDIYESYGWIAASLVMIICSEVAGTLFAIFSSKIR